MAYLLALDQGTTSSRAVLYTPELIPLAIAQREFTQYYPQPGYVEHDPEEIWRSQSAVAQEAIAHAGIDAGAIAAIGITNQRETTVIWDRRSGAPIHNAIVWQDRRTTDWCEQQRSSGIEALVQAKTGLRLDPYFSASKIRWLLDHCDGARAAALRGELAFGTIDSWLVWKLTQGRSHITDASNASRTLLYNLDANDWDDELLELWNIPRALLPGICDSGGMLAQTFEFAGTTLPITGIIGDQQAALFGQSCFAPGDTKCTYGTGCFMLMHTGDRIARSRSGLLSTVAWSLAGQREFALEGSVFIGGAVVQWLRDGLGIITHSSEVSQLAAQVADSGGLVLVPAFTGLGAPYWDADARGLIIGITRGTTAAHIARAALESIALQVCDVIEAMRADSNTGLAQFRVDGGATGSDLLMQLQADLLQTTLLRPRDIESTARGAAALAGLGAGSFAHRAELHALWREDRRFVPLQGAAHSAALKTRWHKAVERAKAWNSPA